MDRIITYELNESQREEILLGLGRLLEGRPEIVFAYVHGSFLEGKRFRDLDLAVYLVGEPSERHPLYELRLGEKARRELALPFPVDARILNRAPIAFRYHALRGRLLTDRDPDRRADFTAYVVGRYLDIRPVLEHFAQEAFF
jgi:predicted nucleotidyltransferase